MKTVCFGELMMRLNPEGYLRIRQASRFEASYAGGEANVAVSLANYGVPAYLLTKLPDNEIGTSAAEAIRRYGVHTDLILRGGERIGIYFVEKGASQRASKVIYDRKNSAIALASPSEFDWDKIFEGCGWFHFTGITPALSDSLAQVCIDACRAAKDRGITVSCDLNYRNSLWSKEKAKTVMGKLMPLVDVCIANEEDASDVFGIVAEETDVDSGKLNKMGYISVAKQIVEQFGCRKVAITLRSSLSANDNDWAGMLYVDGTAYFSKEYRIHIVDRVGGGDSFGGALIYALQNGYDPQKVIEFAVAASCLKQTIEQDFNLVSVKEVETLMNGNGTGRVQR